MARSVEVIFTVGGTSEVLRAFDAIDKRAERADQGRRRAANDDVARTRKAADDKVRAEERAAREAEKIAKKTEQQQIKLTEDSLKAIQKAADQKIRIEDKWAREALNFAHRTSLAKQRILEKEVELVERTERQKAQARERWGRAMGNRLGGGLTHSVGGLIGGATRMAGMALSVGGGFGIADVVQEKFALERQAALLSNQSSTDKTGRVSTADLMRDAKAIGIKNNIKAVDVIGGMNAYFAKTGNMADARKNAELFAQLSTATGSDVTQIGGVAGALSVQNKDLKPEQMRSMLLNIVGQTRTGAVDIADLVQHVPVITSTSALYGGSQTANQRKLIGLSQVAMRTSGSSAEAAEAVQRLGSDLASNADKIRAHTGFNVKDKSGALKDPAEIIAALMQSSGGDIGKLKHMGIGRESMKIFEAEAATFNRAGKGKGGAAAVLQDIKGFEEGGYDEKTLQADVANAMNTNGAKFQQATERVKQVLEEHLTPWLEKFADKLPQLLPKIEKLIDDFSHFVDWFADNPIKGIGAIVLAKITKDLAEAAIGEAVKKTLVTLLGGGGGGSAPALGGGGGSPANMLASTAGLVGVGGGGYDIYNAATNAKKQAKNGRNASAVAYQYLNDWQQGNFGWVGGASWNPLVSLATIATGSMSDAGKIEASDQGKAHVDAFRARGGQAMQGGPDHHAQKTVDLLQKIAENTARGGSGVPSDAQRTHPLGASRGPAQ